jgi:dihydroflavonol-4-reductase
MGATGFVGSHVARALLEAGHEVSGWKRVTSSLELLRGIELPWYEGDLADRDSIRCAVAGKDAVVLATGYLSLWPRARDQLYSVNVLGARHVAEACLEAGVRLLWDGSAGIYAGSTQIEPVDESGVPSPARYDSFHVVSMALAEAEILRAVARGLDAVLLHPTLVVGPGDRSFHSSWLLLAAAHGGVTLCPSGGLNLVAADDLARAHVLALTKAKKGSVYLLGSENLTNRALLDLLQDVTGTHGRVVACSRVPFRALGSVAHALGVIRGRDKLDRVDLNTALARAATLYWFVDSRKAEAELGWKPSSVKPALEAQVDWLRRRGTLAGAP